MRLMKKRKNEILSAIYNSDNDRLSLQAILMMNDSWECAKALVNKIDFRGLNEYDRLPQILRMPVIIVDLFMQMRIGGLIEFYSGDFGGRTDELVEFLHEIGAIKTVSVLSDTIKAFPHGIVPHDFNERLDMLMMECNPEIDLEFIDMLSRQYMTNEEKILDKLQSYLKQNEKELLQVNGNWIKGSF